jgi:hypothetical protein
MGVDRWRVMVYNMRDVCVRSLSLPSPKREHGARTRTVFTVSGGSSRLDTAAGRLHTAAAPLRGFSVLFSHNGIAISASVVRIPRCFRAGRHKTRAASLTLHRVPATVGNGIRAPFRCTAIFPCPYTLPTGIGAHPHTEAKKGINGYKHL